MKHLTLPLLLGALAPFASCTKHEDPKTPPANATGAAPMDDHGHGPRKPLGSMTIGTHTFEVVQFGDVVAGKDTAINLEFAAGKPLPATARAWFGTQSGEGSRKSKLTKDSEHPNALHQHVDAPSPLPAGSALWIEIEENGKTEAKSVPTK
jgi:hypothetical protein